MAIVKNRFDLLVEKTGGANEAINHYSQLMTRVALGKHWRLPQRIEICYQKLRDRNTCPHTWCEDSRSLAYVVSDLYKLTLDFEMLRVVPSVLDLRLTHLEIAIQEIMRRAALDSSVYKPTAELKRKLKIAKEKLSQN